MEAAADERGGRGDPGARFFRIFDENDDGTVSQEEFDTARAELGERRGGSRGNN
jgi:Ca2+-binding EF-hand superfamily protein